MTSDEEQKLLDEINFWVEYIQTWSKNSSDPVPQTAIDSLDNVVLQLKHYYIIQEIIRDKKEKRFH